MVAGGGLLLLCVMAPLVCIVICSRVRWIRLKRSSRGTVQQYVRRSSKTSGTIETVHNE